MTKQLGHTSPLGAVHNLGHGVQHRSLGPSSLAILDLKTFYPHGFPNVASESTSASESTVARSIDTSASSQQASTPSVKESKSATGSAGLGSFFRRSLQRYFSPGSRDRSDAISPASTHQPVSQQASPNTTSIPNLQATPEITVTTSDSIVTPTSASVSTDSNSSHQEVKPPTSAQQPPTGLNSIDINQSIQSLQEQSPIQRTSDNSTGLGSHDSSQTDIAQQSARNLAAPPLNTPNAIPSTSNQADLIQRRIEPSQLSDSNSAASLGKPTESIQISANKSLSDTGSIQHSSDIQSVVNSTAAVQRTTDSLQSLESLAESPQVDLVQTNTNEPTNNIHPVPSSEESVQRAADSTDLTSSVPHESHQINTAQANQFSQKNRPQPSADSLSETEGIQQSSNSQTAFNSGDIVQRAAELPQSTSLSSDVGQPQTPQSVELDQTHRAPTSNRENVVQRTAELTQPTNTSNKVGQTETPQSVEFSQIDTIQVSTNPFSDTETPQNLGNVQPITYSVDTVQRVSDDISERIEANSPSYPDTTSTTNTHGTLQRVTNVTDDSQIIEPDNAPSVQQLPSELATTDIIDTDVSGPSQSPFSPPESIQRVTEVPQRANSGSDEVRSANTAQLLPDGSNANKPTNNIHPIPSSGEAVQRAADFTDLTPSISHEAHQIGTTQSNQFSQTNRPQPSANSFSETEGIQQSSEGETAFNSENIVQRTAEVPQSTNRSNQVSETETPQAIEFTQKNTPQQSANSLAKTEGIQKSSEVQTAFDPGKIIQRTAEVPQSTSISNKVGQPETPQAVDFAQTDMPQVSTNPFFESEILQKSNNDQPITHSVDAVQRVADISGKIEANSTSSPDTTSTTNTQSTLQRVTDVIGSSQIITPDNASSVQQFPSELATTDIPRTDISAPSQSSFSPAESIQRVTEVSQLSNSGSDESRAANTAQLLPDFSTANEPTTNLQPISSSEESVQRTTYFTDLTSSVPYGAYQIDTAQASQFSQTNIPQSSANSFSEPEDIQQPSDGQTVFNSGEIIQRTAESTQSTPEDIQQSSDGQTVFNSGEIIQRTAELTQSTSTSNEIGQTDTPQANQFAQTNTAQRSANSRAKTEGIQQSRDGQTTSNVENVVQRTAELTQLTNTSNEIGHTDTPQLSTNPFSESKPLQNPNNVQPITHSIDAVQRVPDTHSTLQRVTDVTDNPKIIEPDNAPSVQQLSSELATTDITHTDVLAPSQFSQTTIPQPSANSLSKTEEIQKSSDGQTDFNSGDIVQRTVELTQSTSTFNEVNQPELLQASQFAQTNIVQQSANSLAKTENIQKSSGVQTTSNVENAVQRIAELPQPTNTSNAVDKTETPQSVEFDLTHTAQSLTNSVSESGPLQKSNNVQPITHSVNTVQRVANVSEVIEADSPSYADATSTTNTHSPLQRVTDVTDNPQPIESDNALSAQQLSSDLTTTDIPHTQTDTLISRTSNQPIITHPSHDNVLNASLTDVSFPSQSPFNLSESIQRDVDASQLSNSGSDESRAAKTVQPLSDFSTANEPTTDIQSVFSSGESVQRATDFTDLTPSISHESYQIGTTQTNQFSQTTIPQPSENSLSGTKSIQKSIDDQTAFNSGDIVQRIAELPQSTSTSNKVSQIDAPQSVDFTQTNTTPLPVSSPAKTKKIQKSSEVQTAPDSGEIIQRTAELPQPTSTSNRVGQPETPQSAEFTQTHIPQLSTNPVSESETLQSSNNVQPITHSRDRVQRVTDVSGAVKADSPSYTDTTSTTNTHSTLQRVTDVTDNPQIIESDNAPPEQQLPSNSATNDIPRTDVLVPNQTPFKPPESIQRVTATSQLSNSGSDEFGAANAAQLSPDGPTEEAVQRVANLTDLVSPVSYESYQIGTTQANQFTQTNIPQPSANSLSKAEDIQKSSQGQVSSTSGEIVQRMAESIQSTNTSDELDQTELPQIPESIQTHTTQLSTNSVSESYLQSATHSVEIVQKTAELTQSTNIPNKVSQPETSQSVEFSQTDIADEPQIIEPDNHIPSAQQLPSKLATTDVPYNDVLVPIQSQFSPTESIQWVTEASQLSNSGSDQFGAANAPQLLPDGSNANESTNNIHPIPSADESVQRAADFTDLTPSISHESYQIDTTQANQFSQTNIPQPSANSFSETKIIQTSSEVQSTFNPVDIVQNASNSAELVQSTAESTTSISIETDQPTTLVSNQPDIVRLNNVAESEAIQKLSDSQSVSGPTHLARPVQRSSDSTHTDILGLSISKPLPRVLRSLSVLKPLPSLQGKGLKLGEQVASESTPSQPTIQRQESDHIPKAWSNLESLVAGLTGSNSQSVSTSEKSTSIDSDTVTPPSDTSSVNIQRQPSDVNNDSARLSNSSSSTTQSNLEDLTTHLPNNSFEHDSTTSQPAPESNHSQQSTQRSPVSKAPPTPQQASHTVKVAKPATVTVQRQVASSVSTTKPTIIQACKDTSPSTDSAEADEQTDDNHNYSQYLELLAQEVYSLLRQRLSLEQERRGSKYPR